MRKKTLKKTAVIAAAHQKGGVGKTTAAIAAAAEAHRRGYEVLLLDADPQGTATTWADIARENGHPGPLVVRASTGLRVAVAAAPAGSLVVIDSPPALAEILTEALQLADLALLPAGPNPADVFALAGTLELLQAVQAQRPQLAARLLLSRRRPGTALGAAARGRYLNVGVPLLRGELTERVALAEFIASGQGVAEYAPGTAAAAGVAVLFEELLRVLKQVQR